LTLPCTGVGLVMVREMSWVEMKVAGRSFHHVAAGPQTAIRTNTGPRNKATYTILFQYATDSASTVANALDGFQYLVLLLALFPTHRKPPLCGRTSKQHHLRTNSLPAGAGPSEAPDCSWLGERKTLWPQQVGIARQGLSRSACNLLPSWLPNSVSVALSSTHHV
jgi:hypothetical protein